MSSGALVLGLLHGAAIALLGLGIVLVYQANRFLNLAYAQLGAAPALLMARLVLDDGWAWWLAFPVSIAFGAGLGVLVEKLLFSQLRKRTTSTVSLLLLSVGVGQLLLALTYLPALGPDASTLALGGYPEPVDSTVRVGGVVLDGADLTTCVLVPLVIAGITGFLRFTSLGKKVRAAASNADAARLVGISTSRVSLLVWAIAGGLSTVTAILLAPSEGTFTAAALGPYLLLLALGAATFGAFTSIPMTLVGGLVLGVLQQVTLELTSSSDAGKVAILVAVLLVVMVRGKAIGQAFSVGGSGIAVSAPVVAPASLRTHWSVTRRTTVVAGTALAVAVLLPHLSPLSADSRHFQLALITCYALVAVSLCLLVGWSGQVSLGHFAIVGLGAFVTARLAGSGVGLVVIVLLAGLAGAVLMVVVGLPALRVPGLTLAVTSLGLAVIAPIWLLRQPWISDQPFGMPIDGLPAPLRGLPGVGSVQGVYYLGLFLLTATLLLLTAVRGTAFGRAILAVRDNETAAAAFGLTPAAVKTAALAVSGFIAGMAGVVWAGAWQTAAPRAFSADLSLLLLAVPVIGGVTSLAGTVAASTLFFSLTFFVSPYLARVFGDAGKQIGFQLALAGLGVVGTLLAYPGGMAAVGNKLLVRWWRSLDRIATQREAEESAHRDTPLVVQGVEVAFGGVQALRGASIEVRKGEIVGLIGPNGAGKSTLMNVVSGVVTADRASVRVFGTELIGLGREFRAAHGVGRSFQDASLFAGLTVREVIQVAADRRHRSGALSQAFRMPWARAAEAASRADADEVIERLGLGAWADSPLSELSTGTRRICDLAAQAAARPAVLLLDEPTAGVAQRDAEAFGPLLRRLRDELDCSILVIEHDMGLLMGLCDRLYAMDAGAVIAEGTPDEVRANPQVVASYLGTSDTAIDRSGPVTQKPVRTPRKRTPRARLVVSEET